MSAHSCLGPTGSHFFCPHSPSLMQQSLEWNTNTHILTWCNLYWSDHPDDKLDKALKSKCCHLGVVPCLEAGQGRVKVAAGGAWPSWSMPFHYCTARCSCHSSATGKECQTESVLSLSCHRVQSVSRIHSSTCLTAKHPFYDPRWIMLGELDKNAIIQVIFGRGE